GRARRGSRMRSGGLAGGSGGSLEAPGRAGSAAGATRAAGRRAVEPTPAAQAESARAAAVEPRTLGPERRAHLGRVDVQLLGQGGQEVPALGPALAARA